MPPSALPILSPWQSDKPPLSSDRLAPEDCSGWIAPDEISCNVLSPPPMIVEEGNPLCLELPTTLGGSQLNWDCAGRLGHKLLHPVTSLRNSEHPPMSDCGNS